MKKRFLIRIFALSLILVGNYAWAIDPQTPKALCDELSDADARACYGLIQKAKFDPMAVGECDTFSDQDPALECMKIIRNQTFQADALDICDGFDNSADASTCLRSIAGKTYDSEVVAGCASKSIDDTVSCLSAPSLEYAWVSEQQKQCAAYSLKGKFLRFVDNSKCAESGIECLRGVGVLASTTVTTIEGTMYHLIPEIMNLPNGATVPWRDYKKYSPDLIAASLVARLHREYESDSVAHPAYDYEANTILQMRFDDQYIGAIQKSGFLNEHQIDHSNGVLDWSRRASIEDSLIHVRADDREDPGLDNPANTLRPKYTFLTFQKDTDGQQNAHLARDYGNVVAVFKDDVKSRSTFTQVDSLNGDMKDGQTQVGLVHAHTFQYKSKEHLQKIPDDSTDYWEAQVWGNLTMHDVKYFLVNCPGDKEISDESLNALKRSGAPIYQCVYVKDFSHLEKGKPIWAGDPKLVPAGPAQTGSQTQLFKVK